MLFPQKLKDQINFVTVLIVCLIVTFSVWFYVKKQIQNNKNNKLESVIRQTKKAIEERMAIYIDAHYAGSGLFLAQETQAKEVSSKEWQRFVAALNLVDRYPGINGLGFAPQVEHKDLIRFEEKIKRVGIDNFKVKPFRDRDNYFPVTYIDPMERNLPALGFDMGSEKNRRYAMETARDTGTPQVTAKIILVQDSGKTPGFLSYVPFYKGGKIPDTVEKRRADFLGHIYAPFIVKDFISGIFKLELAELKEQISLEIYDGSEAQEDNLIYQSSLNNQSDQYLSSSFNLNFYGRTWLTKIKFFPKNSLLTELQSHLVLVIGLILTVLLLTIVTTLSKTRDKALELAAQMTEEINFKNKLLERSNEDLNSFAYIASHDLKEPLRTVSNYADLVNISINKAQFESEEQKEKVNKFLANISDGCSRMSLMINDLLNFSKVSRDKKDFKNIDLKQILDLSLEELNNQIIENNINVKIADILPELYGNEIELKRVFQNLISNAIKYHSKDKNSYIKISAEEHEDFNIIKVEDNGIGIPEEYFEQIFILFKRLHSKEEYPGTGIGLSVCKKIIEHHNGDIWVKSKVNQETCFYVKIPKEKELSFSQ
ncbi:MAG: CHASE domain-containing protein [Candidatus Caenarcaniphilales bacterium]|nr:CHASE domain-containing protein [Candidatus Caenarcaniphilales bacterium]